MTGPNGLGALLREARMAQNLPPDVLARSLHLPLHLLEAIEADDWEALPPGRERPLARQVADRLGVDLASHADLWERLPGAPEPDPPSPHRERLEHVLGLALALGCVAVGLWLVIPSRGLRGHALRPEAPTTDAPSPEPWSPSPTSTPYPVLGEVIPEPPLTEAGALVILRSIDATRAVIQGEGQPQIIALSVSSPWKGRIPGPFTLSLENAGAVTVEVAGQRIIHGRGIGDAWEGRFDAQGRWIHPPAPPAPPPTAPETSDSPDEEKP